MNTISKKARGTGLHIAILSSAHTEYMRYAGQRHHHRFGGILYFLSSLNEEGWTDT